jgi:hypothetical protein
MINHPSKQYTWNDGHTILQGNTKYRKKTGIIMPAGANGLDKQPMEYYMKV